MLKTNRSRLLDMIGPDDVVLDVGGWADPFERADWVMDLMPYETRGMYERRGWVPPRSATERFTSQTWLQRDLCDREPYPFGDKSVDFVVCSQTLEDVRDPVWVCSELVRIARAGYIEVPSRLEEQSWGVHGDFVGWSHHRWVIDIEVLDIRFVSKVHAIHARPDWYFPPGFWSTLSEEERVQTMWWNGSFTAGERTLITADEADDYFRTFVEAEGSRRGLAPRSGRAPRFRRFRDRRRRAPDMV
jgi:Methyltransferase domain